MVSDSNLQMKSLPSRRNKISYNKTRTPTTIDFVVGVLVLNLFFMLVVLLGLFSLYAGTDISSSVIVIR